MAAKTKTSAAVKNRYAAKAYDRIALLVPKGRKDDIEVRATALKTSVNGLINYLLRSDMGLSVEEWKKSKQE